MPVCRGLEKPVTASADVHNDRDRTTARAHVKIPPACVDTDYRRAFRERPVAAVRVHPTKAGNVPVGIEAVGLGDPQDLHVESHDCSYPLGAGALPSEAIAELLSSAAEFSQPDRRLMPDAPA